VSKATSTQPQASAPKLQDDEVQAVDRLHEKYTQMTTQLAGVIVGMEEVINQLLVAMLCRGHCILEGVPGLAKTLLVSTVASILGLKFRRIQFTPDLMPADITGSDVLVEDQTTGKRVFQFIKGPLFAHIILADEINRTPPKTQSALLEAMQEQQLTVGGHTYPLLHPFFVLATQNPIEQEGTYPLPEAQLDRFMMKIKVGYPSEAEEVDIVKRITTDYEGKTDRILSGEEIEQMQAVVRKVPVGEHVYTFATRLVRATRPKPLEGNSRDGMVKWGAGPRASIFLVLAAKARAILQGRYHATTTDVLVMAPSVLRHRVIPTFNAEAAGKTADDIINHMVEAVRLQSLQRAKRSTGR